MLLNYRLKVMDEVSRAVCGAERDTRYRCSTYTNIATDRWLRDGHSTASTMKGTRRRSER